MPNHGKGGGIPLPDEVKKARGTYQPAKERWKARQAALAAPGTTNLPRVAVPPPPDGLSAQEAAWWVSLGRAVTALGVYTEADEPAFRALVRAYALMEDILDGRVMEPGRNGQGPREVSATTAVAATRAVSSMLARFGLDPAARPRLAVPPPVSTSGGAQPADPDDLEPIQ